MYVRQYIIYYTGVEYIFGSTTIRFFLFCLSSVYTNSINYISDGPLFLSTLQTQLLHEGIPLPYLQFLYIVITTNSIVLLKTMKFIIVVIDTIKL